MSQGMKTLRLFFIIAGVVICIYAVVTPLMFLSQLTAITKAFGSSGIQGNMLFKAMAPIIFGALQSLAIGILCLFASQVINKIYVPDNEN